MQVNLAYPVNAMHLHPLSATTAGGNPGDENQYSLSSRLCVPNAGRCFPSVPWYCPQHMPALAISHVVLYDAEHTIFVRDPSSRIYLPSLWLHAGRGWYQFFLFSAPFILQVPKSLRWRLHRQHTNFKVGSVYQTVLSTGTRY